jgi:hypothetical protein
MTKAVIEITAAVLFEYPTVVFWELIMLGFSGLAGRLRRRSRRRNVLSVDGDGLWPSLLPELYGFRNSGKRVAEGVVIDEDRDGR